MCVCICMYKLYILLISPKYIFVFPLSLSLSWRSHNCPSFFFHLHFINAKTTVLEIEKYI